MTARAELPIAPSCTPADPTGRKALAEAVTDRANDTADRVAAKLEATLASADARDAAAPFIPTLDQLGEIMPIARSDGRLAEWHGPLTDAMLADQINTPSRVAPFLANVAEETGELVARVENLNYSADQMIKTWPGFFTSELANSLAFNPQGLANYIYADATRPKGYKLGNVYPGDGWLFRGRGPTQLTGRDAYEKFFDAVGLPRNTDPNELLKPSLGSRSSTWHWRLTGCNTLADAGEFRSIVVRLNGGTINYATRLAYLERAKKTFGLLL